MDTRLAILLDPKRFASDEFENVVWKLDFPS